MTVEELLQDRVIQLIDYPNQHDYKAGKIYHLGAGWKPKEWFLKYPKVFRLMEWWEERDVKDMPDYVKSISTALNTKIGEVCKVKAYAKDIKKNGVFLEGKSFSRLIETLEPSTEQDYLNYIQQQEKQ